MRRERKTLPKGYIRDTKSGEVFTPREAEVLRLVVRGKSNPEIGAALGIGRRTVRQNIENLMEKLQAGCRTLVAVKALARGLVTFEEEEAA